MKKILSFIAAAALFTAAATAQVSADIAEKCFKIMDESREVQAYHGDYSATISLVVEKPGKPKENLQYKIFERTDRKLMTIVQLFPEADKGTGYLRNDDNIWSYDPISRKFTHTSIKEAIGDSDIKLDDEARAAVVDRVKELIERFEGTVTDVDDWGKKKLAYEIQKMNEGFYYFIKFDAEGDKIHEIENRMRIMDNVIRYLCVKQEEA